MNVPGFDAINFGPADYSMSKNSRTGYDINQDFVLDALKEIVTRARPKNIGVMAPAAPPTYENVKNLISKGVNMILMSSDYNVFINSLRNIRDVIDKTNDDLK
jgi:4-hydroxy-2-oxoheptanedioate aldolase